MREESKNWIEEMKKGNTGEANRLKEEIFKETMKRFEKENRGKWEIEILTVGNTPEPLILSILALKPKKAVFICTKESRETLNRVVTECQLEPASYYPEEITSKANAEDVYEVINRYCREREEKNVCIDITGGTKAMVGGAAMAAGVLHLPLFYVNVDQKKIHGRDHAVPDSEQLVELKNPFDVFKTVEEKIAMKLMDEYAYAGARTLLEECIADVRDMRKRGEFQIKTNIVLGYMHWDMFDYGEAETYFRRALRDIDQFSLCKKCKEIVTKQKVVVSILRNGVKDNLSDTLRNKECAFHLIVDMFMNAERRSECQQFSEGVLMLYRVLEFITQYELVRLGITPDNVSEEIKKEFGSSFREKAKVVYNAEKDIPSKVGLMDSVILLQCLAEKGKNNVVSEPLGGEDDLKNFQKRIYARNVSILVHGIKKSTQEDYTQMKESVKEYMERLIGKNEMAELLKLHCYPKSSEMFD